MNSRHPPPANGTDDIIFTPHEVRSYVAQARTYRPVVPENVSEYMVKTYVRMRDAQKRAEKKGQQFTHTTPRTLLGVVRLAQALARLRFSNRVTQDDVDEALRLIEASKESLAAEQGTTRTRLNASSKIYNMVKALADSGACKPDDADEDDEFGGELSLRKVRERVIAKGFTEDQWLAALDEYTELDVSYHPGETLTTTLTHWKTGLADCWQHDEAGIRQRRRQRRGRRRHGCLKPHRGQCLSAYLFSSYGVGVEGDQSWSRHWMYFLQINRPRRTLAGPLWSWMIFKTTRRKGL